MLIMILFDSYSLVIFIQMLFVIIVIGWSLYFSVEDILILQINILKNKEGHNLIII